MGELPNKRISIIMPSFQQAEYIEESINSVLSINYPNIEFIVVDGGSTDGTEEILRKYSRYISKLIIEKDRGQSDAIIKGIAAATGDFITWINSDDLLLSDYVDNILEYFEKYPEIDFIYGNCDVIDQQSNKIREDHGAVVEWPKIMLEHHLPIPQQGAIWRRKLTEKIEGPKLKYHYVLDREFFLRVLATHKALYVNKVFGKFRYHPDSKSIKHELKWTDELVESYKELCREFSIDKRFELKILSSVSMHCAYIYFKGGNFISAINLMFQAFMYDKLILLRRYTYVKLLNKIMYLMNK